MIWLSVRAVLVVPADKITCASLAKAIVGEVRTRAYHYLRSSGDREAYLSSCVNPIGRPSRFCLFSNRDGF